MTKKIKKIKNNEFECALCHNIYKKDWPDEKQTEEGTEETKETEKIEPELGENFEDEDE